MTNNEDHDPGDHQGRGEMRIMWIFSAAVVLLILGMMGVNMLIHHDTGPSEISSQSRMAPQQ
jgi:hypothetical protein